MPAIAPAETCAVQLTSDLYKDVREFLSMDGKSGPAEINCFVEAAVSNYLLRKSTKQLQAAVAHIPDEDLSEMIEEALDWARASR